ncbi:kinase-like protein [Exidia glandulosa HHB12029]|uniref:Kinase-like protein n=1 Tax=Exidia glandulosa HHB12029 TaxID=1314781 RepID=A0A165HZV8_EXIGL|nr:kinase-like protein [Exidia glandulosa HHB12029]
MAFMAGDYYGTGLADGSSEGTAYTSESYHTALDIFQMSRYSESASSGTFKSIIDPALVDNDVSTTDDLRLVFSKIDISQELFDVSHIVVGKGGYSDVVRGNLRTVRDTLMVAIKKPRALHRDPAFLKKLAGEIALWNSVIHRNILPLLGLAWIENDIPAMVSPWCQHGNIMEFLAQKRDDEHLMSVICRLLRDVLQGLGHLHHIKITHGDLKGANVLISDDGVARVGDFGMSVVLAQYPGKDASMFGTLRWTAPDLFREDSRPLTPECDIWSFGCVVLEVVSNTKPHYTIEEELKVIIALGRNLAPARPPNFPDPVWRLCQDCFLVEPQQRPSAGQLLESMAQLETLYDVDGHPFGDGYFATVAWNWEIPSVKWVPAQTAPSSADTVDFPAQTAPSSADTVDFVSLLQRSV